MNRIEMLDFLNYSKKRVEQISGFRGINPTTLSFCDDYEFVSFVVGFLNEQRLLTDEKMAEFKYFYLQNSFLNLPSKKPSFKKR